MSYRLDILEHPGPGAVLARLSGYGSRDDRHLVEDFDGECERHGWRSVIMDLTDLGGITQTVAAALAVLGRHLDDQGGGLVFVAPNVAVHWLLVREFGSEPDCAVDVSGALSALEITTTSDVSAAADPEIQPVSELRPGGIRPERGIAATLNSALKREEGPERWLSAMTAAMAMAGLADRVVFCRRVGDHLHVVGRRAHSLPADGWLGSFLATTGVLLEATELSERGLANEERAYLRWSGAELHLPLVFEGRLVGLLSFDTGRERGLIGLRSSEVLALECVGLVLTSHLVAYDAGSMQTTDIDDLAGDLADEHVAELMPIG